MLKLIKSKYFISNLLLPLVVIVLALVFLRPAYAIELQLKANPQCKIKRDRDLLANAIKNFQSLNFKKVVEQTFHLNFDYKTNFFYSLGPKLNYFITYFFACNHKDTQLLARAPPSF